MLTKFFFAMTWVCAALTLFVGAAAMIMSPPSDQIFEMLFWVACVITLLAFSAYNFSHPDAPQDFQKIMGAVPVASSNSEEITAAVSENSPGNNNTLGENIDPSAIWTSIFSFDGAIGRRAFWLGEIAAALALLTALAVIFSDSKPHFLLRIFFFALFLAGLIASWSIAFRRMSDTGANKWWTLLFFVPPLNVAVFIFLGFVPTGEFSKPTVSQNN